MSKASAIQPQSGSGSRGKIEVLPNAVHSIAVQTICECTSHTSECEGASPWANISRSSSKGPEVARLPTFRSCFWELASEASLHCRDDRNLCFAKPLREPFTIQTAECGDYNGESIIA
jgi:hypothetical protein